MERIGPYSFLQHPGVKLTADSVALAEFVLPLGPDDTVIDIGTGTGAVPLMVAGKSPVERIVGVEVEAAFSEVARRNVLSNGLSTRIEILETDFRRLPEVYPEGSFSAVVSNPPYTKAGSGRPSPGKERDAARRETRGTLRDLVRVSRYLAGSRGRVFYVFTVKRLDEMMEELEAGGLEPERLEFVFSGKEPNVFLVEARGTEGEAVEKPPGRG